MSLGGRFARMALKWLLRLGAGFYRLGAGEIIVMGQVQECMDGPRLLRMRLGELVPHSLRWNCALGVGG